MYNGRMNKTIFEIKKGRFFKFILGLGNSDAENIKKLSAIYASSGVDMFDLTPSEVVYDAVYEGIKSQNLDVEDFSYCISFSLGEDKHGRKAQINPSECSRCFKCLKKCPQNAIEYDKISKIIFVKQEKCIGCSKCSFCSAIKFSKENPDIIKKTKELKSKYKVDCIELHISGLKAKNLKEILKKIKQEFPDIVVSICTPRERLSDNDLKKLLEKAVKIIGKDNFIFQADGLAMSGEKDDYSSTLQSIATAQVVEDLGLNIILSGGTNSKTYELAQKCNVKINGVSIGSYGRNLVKEEIQNPEIWYNIEVLNSALKKAKLLVDSVKK